jgi:D-serine deaminase-like pyridoxal phosphate-dependent protein
MPTPDANPLAIPAPARPGQPRDQIDTPSLVLDMAVFERNLDRMQAAARAAGVALRPHAKAHKCPDIALAQTARGAVGICCQKVTEAIPFINAGITDIHISNEVAGAGKAALLASLARHARLSVCVDAAEQVEELARAVGHADTRLDVLVEVDIGQQRCGVTDTGAALCLAEQITRHDRLSFRGLQAYHGGMQHLRGHAARRDAAAQAAARTAGYVAALEAAGMHCAVVTGGGTGSVEFDLRSGVYTEIQPGSYVFMDADYGSNETAGGPAAMRFEHALFIATTVMSTASASRVVLDAGLKSMAVDSGLPWIWQDGKRSATLGYMAANDEHGIVQPLPGNSRSVLPPLGAGVLLVPGHCDPTLNLYDTLVTVRGEAVEALWPILARGLSR